VLDNTGHSLKQSQVIIRVIIIIIIIKYREKLETIQHITWACRVLTPGDYTHLQNQAAKIVLLELAIKCGLTKGKRAPYYKYKPQCLFRELIKYTMAGP
jgi:hypothetical protein